MEFWSTRTPLESYSLTNIGNTSPFRISMVFNLIVYKKKKKKEALSTVPTVDTLPALKHCASVVAAHGTRIEYGLQIEAKGVK
jgi:hypothetical protein